MTGSTPGGFQEGPQERRTPDPVPPRYPAAVHGPQMPLRASRYVGVSCAEPGCPATVTVPEFIADSQVLSSHTKCPAHTDPTVTEEPPPGRTVTPTAAAAWGRVVPAPIRHAYAGRPPRIPDLPPELGCVDLLTHIAKAWPARAPSPLSPRPLRALVLGGGAGSLKTTSAYALVGSLVAAGTVDHRRVFTATEAEIVDDKALLDRLASKDIVLIDDVGQAKHKHWGDENRHGWWLSVVDLADRRGKFLILTTNFSSEQGLSDYVGYAAASRLAGMVGAVAAPDTQPGVLPPFIVGAGRRDYRVAQVPRGTP